MVLKKYLFVLFAGMLLFPACVKVNTDLGQNLAPRENRYEVFYEEIPLRNIRVQRGPLLYRIPDRLS